MDCVVGQVGDIETRRDVELLIDSFYEKMLKDAIIGFIFTDIAKTDLREHKHIISDFWETVLFGKAAYRRGPKFVSVHKDLDKKIPLKKGHFRRWLFLFHSTVDELFEGKRANFAKDKADLMAVLLRKRIGVSEGNGGLHGV